MQFCATGGVVQGALGKQWRCKLFSNASPSTSGERAQLQRVLQGKEPPREGVCAIDLVSLHIHTNKHTWEDCFRVIVDLRQR